MKTDIIGHKQIVAFLEKAVEMNRQSHAYCFAGSENLGKRKVAGHIASLLLKCDNGKLASCPDYMEMRRQKDEKSGKTKKNIDVEQIRHANLYLSQRPMMYKSKVLVIDGAEKMNINSANAFLKSLEEPSKTSTIFLIVKDETSLPKTILSRCQTIFFHHVQKGDIEKYLLEQGLDQSKSEEMARLCLGRPGRAIDWLQNEENYYNYKREVGRFEKLIDTPLYEKMKLVDDLFGDKTDHIEARENLINVLGIWSILVRDILLTRAGEQGTVHKSEKIKKRWPEGKELSVLNRIKFARENLDRNVHPKLLVERILVDMP